MATDDVQGGLRDLPSISLVDHTAPTEELGSDVELTKSPTSITKTLTQGSLRQTIARRKYQRSKWQEGRDSQSYTKYPPEAAEEGEGSTSDQPNDGPAQSPQDGSDSDNWGKGRVRRGGQKVKDAIRAPKHKGSEPAINDSESHIDILYENQRGFFFAGIPHFSSNSLLNFDPAAWLDSRFRPSAVNITNAQVPDPSWEWSWRCWYVDMSADVDEEGWEYSLWFGKRTAWHGTHPWFHSFVRRRRWLRKRSKRKGSRPKEEAHALTSDYFTIHSKSKPTEEEDAGSLAASENRAQYSAATSNAWGAKTWENQVDLTEITNIPDLIRGLKSATIDREKILVVRRFLDYGAEELHYLAENMEHIMKLLVFQNSRRQLLSILMHEFETAEHHREEHREGGEEESEDEKRHIDNLLKAVEAADEQCKQLEYWSDIREMARDGEIVRASDHLHGWDHGWQGLDASGPDARGGAPTHVYSENESLHGNKDKGKQPARGTDQIGVPGGQADGATETKVSKSTKVSEDDPSRPSADSAPRDAFYSPEEEKTHADATQLPAGVVTAQPPQENPTPSQESQISLDTYESAHGGQEDDDEDDTATERAPSEDEGEANTPPTGTTPIDALTQVLNGHTKEDKGTTS